jgi:hypothetical protein
MKLYFYRGTQNNFGDELNHWLIPKVFPDFFDEDGSKLFLAIGSIILDNHPKDALKIVFGSGYGGYTPMPVIDETWKFYCVRGEKTADACGLPPEFVAGDSAILIKRFQPPPRAKRFKYSLMPHWESVEHINWRRACSMAGIHFIDPRDSVDDVLAQIQETEVLVTEAMHGAIVADALRVRWIAILPIVPKHRAKWYDWASALGLALEPVELSVAPLLAAQFGPGKPGLIRRLSAMGWLGARIANLALAVATARSLRQASRAASQLSSDESLENAVQHLEAAALRIKQDFPRPQ